MRLLWEELLCLVYLEVSHVDEVLMGRGWQLTGVPNPMVVVVTTAALGRDCV